MEAKYLSIKKACETDSKIFSEIISGLQKGEFSTEKDISRFILYRFRQFGVRSAFPPIVANNCAEIHASPRDKKLTHGFLVLDFGCRVNDLASDFTRTIFLGRASGIEKGLYRLVQKCQQECVARVKVGADCRTLDTFARKKLGKLSRFFIHSLGHGIGRRIHMRPRVSSRSRERLAEGQFITIEPGIYMKRSRGRKELGIRIEDTLFVGGAGGAGLGAGRTEVLTRAPRKFMEVKI